jgi:predicted transcriptional regulator
MTGNKVPATFRAMPRTSSGDALRAAWIQWCLARRGHSQQDVADRASVTKGFVSKVIAGTKGARGSETIDLVWKAIEQLTKMKRPELERPPISEVAGPARRRSRT